jgi:HD-GYP domain-containing protein (c-di-GMP phosphodiesterase class II)
VQEALGQVFERWDGRGKPHGLRGEEVARSVRIVLLAHDVQHFEQFGGVETAVAMARGRAGGAHDPRIVDHFCRNAPALLSLLGQSHDWDTFLAEEPGPRPRLVASSFDRALQAIGDFVDLNAPWFGGHSRGVAELAGTAASAARLPEVEVDAIRRAGWLHDLGQIGISWSIWDKRGALTASEWERVRLHPYFAERVLMRSPQLVALGAISGLHHERLDASGYHRGLPAALLSTTARLLAATEAFRGVSEALPHHPPRSAEAAADLLLDEVSAGRLDGEAVQAVLTAAGQARRIRRVWPAGLSEREVEVLRLVARGLSNRQMAERLSISKETVNHHVRHIYDKLGVSTRAGATVFAMQHDLLTDLLPIGK